MPVPSSPIASAIAHTAAPSRSWPMPCGPRSRGMTTVRDERQRPGDDLRAEEGGDVAADHHPPPNGRPHIGLRLQLDALGRLAQELVARARRWRERDRVP